LKLSSLTPNQASRQYCFKMRELLRFNPPSPSLVGSSHLDDAVLSCGQFLSSSPQSVVLTVLAGAPEKLHDGYNAITTGERYAPDAVRTRKDEDAAAMAFLSVRTPEWLELYGSDFIDWHRFDRIRHRSDHNEIKSGVIEAIGRINPKSVFSPLGLVHPDHLAVANACIELSNQSDREWFI